MSAGTSAERNRGKLTYWVRRKLTKTLATHGMDKPSLAEARRQAIQQAAEVGDETVVPLFVNALRDEWIIVREAAALALGKLQATGAVDSLIEMIKSDNSADVRRIAGQALVAIGDGKAVLPLLKLGLDQPPQRLWLSDSIARMGKPALPPLLSCLKHPDAGLRLDAVVVLGKLKLKEAVPPLILAAVDPAGVIRAHIAEALGNIGDNRAVPTLVKFLDDLDSGVRANAAAALSKMPDERAFDSLMNLLEDENVAVRGFAATSLGGIGDSRAAPVISHLLQDESEDLRGRAIEALGELDDPRTAEWLLPLLEDERTPIRLKTVQTLGKIGAKSAVPSMLAALNDFHEQVRKSTAEALGRIGSDEAVPALITTLSKDRSVEVQLAAVRSLGQLGDPAAITALKEALSTDFSVRCRVCVALGDIGTPASTEILMTLLADPAAEIRYHAAVSLGTICDPVALKPLEGLMNDKDPFVLRGVGRALQALGDPRGDKVLEQSRELSVNPARTNLATSTVAATTGTPARVTRARGPRTNPLETLRTVLGSVQENVTGLWSRAAPEDRLKYFGAPVAVLLLLTVGWWFFFRSSNSVAPSVMQSIQRGSVQSTALLGDSTVVVLTSSGRCEQWNRSTGEMRTFEKLEGATQVNSSGDGKWLAVTYSDSRIEIRDAQGAVAGTVTAPGKPALIQFNSQGTALAVATLDGQVMHCNLPSGGNAKQHTFKLPLPAQAAAVSPDHQFAAFGLPNGKVMMYKLVDDSEFATIPAHEEPVTALTFSLDNATLVTGGSGGETALWDLIKRKRIAKLMNLTGKVTKMALSPDGKQLARGIDSGAVSICELAKLGQDPKDATNKQAEKRMAPGDDVQLERIDALTFDGHTVAAGGISNDEVFVWDAATGQVLKILTPIAR